MGSPLDSTTSKKTNFILTDRRGFMLDLIRRINNLIKLADKKGLIPVVRLNGTSDIPFENIKIKACFTALNNGEVKPIGDTLIGAYYNIFELFPDITFYDYTKYPLNKRGNNKTLGYNIANNKGWNRLPDNYDLTFSLAENNWTRAKAYLDNKEGRVSAVFSHNIPKTYKGYKVINGDNSDLRFLEPKGLIIGLKFKGSIVDRIKGINSGFVIYNNNKGVK